MSDEQNETDGFSFGGYVKKLEVPVEYEEPIYEVIKADIWGDNTPCSDTKLFAGNYDDVKEYLSVKMLSELKHLRVRQVHGVYDAAAFYFHGKPPSGNQNLPKKTTREMVREFHEAFGAPVRNVVYDLSDAERILRGKLLLEEVLEYLVDGLGLSVKVQDKTSFIYLGRPSTDIIACADGLGDINIIIHGSALMHGFDLDKVTEEIHSSNMSKLGADGKPIINIRGNDGNLLDSNQPAGKILKGPNYRKPFLASILLTGADNDK